MDALLDAVGALEQEAHRQRVTASSAEKLADARAKIIFSRNLKVSFYSRGAVSMNFLPDWTIDTGATDGRRMIYNPDFVEGLTPGATVGFIVHETLHNLLGHHARLGDRNPELANIAMDLAINGPLRKCGIELPPGGLLPGEGAYAKYPDGLMFEEYYARLRDDKQHQQPQGAGKDPGKCGGVMKPGKGSPDECKAAEQAARQILQDSIDASKGLGTLPGNLQKQLGEALTPQVNWREALRSFVTKLAKSDYSWSRPNRRFLDAGLYLPSLRSYEIGDVVVAFDTSGSIYCDAELLAKFAGEINSIMAEFPTSTLTVIYADDGIQRVDVLHAGEGDELSPDAPGGGGTSHIPVFEYIAKMDSDEPPSCVICLTDLETVFPRTPPEIPVLWITNHRTANAPFGETVRIN
jgi:predicted metal-dependent peptidase